MKGLLRSSGTKLVGGVLDGVATATQIAVATTAVFKPIEHPVILPVPVWYFSEVTPGQRYASLPSTVRISLYAATGISNRKSDEIRNVDSQAT